MAENNVIPFIYEESPVRVVRDDHGEPWFVAKDVCRILGAEQTCRATDLLDDDEKGVQKVHTLGGVQEMITINEAGLYTLMIRSNKPQAKPFRRWVTHQVLPTLRKTGKFSMQGNEQDIAAMLGANQRNIKSTQRIKLLELAKSLGQLDEVGRRQVLLIYADLCAIISSGTDNPEHMIYDKGVQSFMDERCSFESDAITPKDNLYDEYLAYAQAHNHAVVSKSLFFRWLYKYSAGEDIRTTRPKYDGLGRRGSLAGIKLN